MPTRGADRPTEHRSPRAAGARIRPREAPSEARSAISRRRARTAREQEVRDVGAGDQQDAAPPPSGARGRESARPAGSSSSAPHLDTGAGGTGRDARTRFQTAVASALACDGVTPGCEAAGGEREEESEAELLLGEASGSNSGGCQTCVGGTGARTPTIV